MPTFSVHDAEVLGMRFTPEDATLRMEVNLQDGQKAQVVFQGAEEWTLDAFGPQNVLFGIQPWTAQVDGTTKACAELGLEPYWVGRVLSGALNLYVLEPSVGVALTK
jgi:hypothetical protein